ncbi:MAG: permease-like cell division protein FtsX [Clostridia bacterium]|nr:permease-like cell division protein FtsX [Clostridia bacterium]
MNGCFFNCFIKEKFKKLLSSGALSLFVVCCIFVAGFALTIFSCFNTVAALEPVKQHSNVIVLLKRDITGDEVAEVGRKIAAVPNISNCEYYPSEKALEKYKYILGGLYDIVKEQENLFPEAYHITVEDLSAYDETISRVKAIPNVDSVSDSPEVNNI